MKSLNTDVKNMLDSVIDSIEKGQTDKSSKELSYIYRYLTECVNNLQEYQDPNELNLDSHNNSNYQNLYFEDDSRTDKGKSSYITQNYEKFKQQQQREKSMSQNIHHQQQNSLGQSTSNYQPNSFIGGSKSSIIQSLANKTPTKTTTNNTRDSQSQSQSSSIVNNAKSNSTVKQPLHQFNPNPLTSHLKTSSNNEKFMNKFMMASNQNKNN